VRIAVSTPGAPELAWLDALLAGARLRPVDVRTVSLGTRGAAGAVGRGEVQVALVAEPFATELVDEGRATVLVDLRTPAAVAQALGRQTVDTGVFARRQQRPDDVTLAAFARALVAAQAQIAGADGPALAARLPESVTAGEPAFARRLDAARTLYLPRGEVTDEQVRATLRIMLDHLPISPAIKVPPAAELLHLVPLTPRAPAPRR
jgi:ABC-type nitrate/sulfonate/bicarbonate transport system substrate-binding protein